MKINDEKKYLIAIAALTIISAGMILYIIIPAVGSMRENKIKIENEYQGFESLLSRGQNLEKTIKDFETVNESYPELANVFLSKEKELEFITSLEEISQETGVTQQIIFSTEKTKKTNNIDIKPISLHLNGKLADILTYLNRLEALDYYVNLNSIKIFKNISMGRKNAPGSLNEDDGSSAGGSLNVQLSGETYWK